MISAIILTHNDEKILRRVLASVSWCDEVIVVDDQSSDKTVSLAKKMGARIFSHPLADDFSAQRNFGLTQAQGEWVLFVDSDEEVSKELQQEIQTATKSENYVGYFLKRDDIFLGKRLQFGETAQVRLLRLAKKGSGQWKRRVHEHWDVSGETAVLEEPLIHYPHPTLTEFISDINRYSTLHAAEALKKKTSISSWEIFLYPLAKFFQNYIYHQGFRDGTPGAILAIGMSFHSFLAKGKAYLRFSP